MAMVPPYLRVASKAKDAGFRIVCLPPKTSCALQPLDIASGKERMALNPFKVLFGIQA